MENKIITIILGMFLISCVSAVDIQAGTSDTFQINTTDTIYYDVINNKSNLDGLNITQDIYGDYSNITISIDFMYEEDSFTLIFFNKEKEVVHKYSSGSCSSCSGGGIRTVYKNVTKYVDRNVTTIDDPDTTIDIDTPPIVEDEKPITLVLIGIIVIGIIVLLLIGLGFIIFKYVNVKGE